MCLTTLRSAAAREAFNYQLQCAPHPTKINFGVLLPLLLTVINTLSKQDKWPILSVFGWALSHTLLFSSTCSNYFFFPQKKNRNWDAHHYSMQGSRWRLLSVEGNLKGLLGLPFQGSWRGTWKALSGDISEIWPQQGTGQAKWIFWCFFFLIFSAQLRTAYYVF